MSIMVITTMKVMLRIVADDDGGHDAQYGN